jgi:RNA methyltransferase, TrmH family
MHEKKTPLINNPRDANYLALRSLQTSQGRSRTGSYIVEGIRHVARAVEHKAPILSLFIDPSVLSNHFGRELLKKLQRSGVPCARLSPQLYRELTLASEPQGIGAIIRQHWTPIAALRPARDSLWLALESIDSPGNLGNIIRTAEATGVSGIFMLGNNPDPWDPASARASMGSLFSQTMVRCSVGEFTHWAKSFGVATVGSSPGGLLDFKAMRCRWPAVLLVGSEKYGLPEHLLEIADFMVRIPMCGRCDSLNVAVATGVLLFEMSNWRPKH